MSDKKTSLYIRITGLLFIACILTPVIGNTAAQQALTGTQIENLIRSSRPLGRLENKYDLPEKAPKGTDIGPMSHALNNLRGHKAYDEFLSIIKKSGFSSAVEWANVGDRIIRAYIALNIPENSQQDMKAKMQEALKQLESNPYITDEQKQMMKAQMEKSLPALNPEKYSSPEDMKVVRPYLKRLEKAFDAEY